MGKKKLIGTFMLLLASLFWGMSYPLQSMTSSDIAPYTLATIKNMGCFLMIPVLIIGKHKITKRDMLCGLITGVITITGTIVQQMGIEISSVNNASFLSALYIVLVPIFGLFLGKKPKKTVWLAVLLALVGVYFLCLAGTGAFVFSKGDIYLLISVVFWTLQIIFVDIFVQKSDPYVMVFAQQLTCFVIATTMTIFYEKPDLSPLANMVPIVIYYATLSGIVAAFLQIRFQKDIDPSIASLTLSLESVFGTLGGFFILHQTLTGNQIIGSALIFISVLLGQL